MSTRRNSHLPNPFYVFLMLVSTLFVVTAIAYWVGPMIALKAIDDPHIENDNPATTRLVSWLDRNAPGVLGIEVVAMFVLGTLAMATDHWFGAGKYPASASRSNAPLASAERTVTSNQAGLSS